MLKFSGGAHFYGREIFLLANKIYYEIRFMGAVRQLGKFKKKFIKTIIIVPQT